MDVRCESCLTIYELDDARVGEHGLTVKCQECGNLFKVRRRQETTELVSPVQAVKAEKSDDASRVETIASRRTPAIAPAPPAAEPALTGLLPAEVPADAQREVGWMLRFHATQEVKRFRELTTLQQWIVERKVAREDEISRGGESWKPLGGIAELASFFHVVEQAESVARATHPGLAVQRANQTGGLNREQIARLSTNILPTKDVQGTPKDYAKMFANSERTVVDEELEIATTNRADAQPRRSVLPWVLLVLASAGAGLGGYALSHRHGGGGAGSGEAADERKAEARAIVERGHAALVLDTDDGYRQAIALLDRLIEESDASMPQLDARVELAEAHVLWATYLAEDARQLEGGASASAARTMRSEAQAHLERARRVLEEPTGPEAQASTRLSLAFADLLRAEGAPTDAIERYLERARSGARDPALPIIEGELELRDDKTSAAQTHFADAAQTPGSDVARARFRLAQIAQREAHTAELAKQCEAIFAVSPKHERGHALCERPVVVDAAVAATADAAAPKGKDSLAPDKELGKELSSDYKSLVHDADHLAQTNRAPQAAKLYDRALELDPKGLEALIGLGNCDLAAERFLQAADRFGAALAIDPNAGDAMIGLAQSYKIRGRNAQAIEMYKKYLSTHSDGMKAALAERSLHQLESPNPGAAEDTTLPHLPSEEPAP